MRRIALVETGGFDDGLIAGEEPELCRRIRACGFKILHIDEPMTLHDLGIKHWSQYLKRAMRAGYAYAEISGRFRDSDEAFWSLEQRANVLRCSCWVISFAAAGIATVRFGAIPFAFWFTLLLVLSLRSAWRARWASSRRFTGSATPSPAQFICSGRSSSPLPSPGSLPDSTISASRKPAISNSSLPGSRCYWFW